MFVKIPAIAVALVGKILEIAPNAVFQAKKIPTLKWTLMEMESKIEFN